MTSSCDVYCEHFGENFVARRGDKPLLEPHWTNSRAYITCLSINDFPGVMISIIKRIPTCDRLIDLYDRNLSTVKTIVLYRVPWVSSYYMYMYQNVWQQRLPRSHWQATYLRGEYLHPNKISHPVYRIAYLSVCRHLPSGPLFTKR